MKQKLKWIAAVLAVLLVGMATALFLWPRDRIIPESWGQIEIGMTENQELLCYSSEPSFINRLRDWLGW
jgi:hypothetical protein